MKTISLLSTCIATEWRKLMARPALLVPHFMVTLALIVFFPLSQVAEKARLQEMAGGYLWVVCLLQCIWAYHYFFEEDQDNGVLEQYALLARGVEAVVFSKILTKLCNYAKVVLCVRVLV